MITYQSDTPPPQPTHTHTPWRNVGDIWRMIRDYVTKLPPSVGDSHSLAGSLLFMSQIRDTYTGTSASLLKPHAMTIYQFMFHAHLYRPSVFDRV